MTKILVPTAGAASANETAKYIVEVTRRLNAELVTLHILGESDSETAGEETLRIFTDWGAKLGVKVTGSLGRGEIVEQIVQSAKQNEIDLIIMGASKGRVVSEWISAEVMGQTATPVLVIPHEFKAV